MHYVIEIEVGTANIPNLQVRRLRYREIHSFA